MNNVGVFEARAFPEITDAEWVHMLEVNLLSGVRLARHRGETAAEVELDFFRNAGPTSLLQRFETPEEIAALVAFVASKRASGVNGAALRVDGGVVRAIV